MATSKSTETCTATAGIYSGRRDPSWRLRKSLVSRLESIWGKLSPSAASIPAAPGLGYRGCSVNCGRRGVWTAFGGVVEHGRERRADPERLFERTVLQSAPKKVVPPEILRMVQ